MYHKVKLFLEVNLSKFLQERELEEAKVRFCTTNKFSSKLQRKEFIAKLIKTFYYTRPKRTKGIYTSPFSSLSSTCWILRY